MEIELVAYKIDRDFSTTSTFSSASVKIHNLKVANMTQFAPLSDFMDLKKRVAV